VTSYLKALAAFLGAALVALISAQTDNAVSPGEIAQIALVGFGATVVYIVPNLPGYTYAKTAVAALTAGLTLLAAYLTDDIGVDWDLTNPEKLNILLAVGTALGVFLVPNSPAHPEAIDVTSRQVG